MKTRGAVLWEPGCAWNVETIDLDPPQHGEVLVRMVAGGLCHSDHHFNDSGFDIPTPVVGGHEGAGVVEELGPGVEGLAVGDHVITTFIPSCGQCHYCAGGLGQLCDRGGQMMAGTALDGTRRLSVNGTPGFAMTWTGTFAEHSVAPAHSLIRIEKDVPLETVVLISCGVPTGWGSAVNLAGVRPGDTVVVIGCGGVGMNAVQGAAFAGAAQIVAIDPVPFKREIAVRTFGATHAVASIEEALPLVIELTHGRKADQAIIHVGVVEGWMVKAGLDLIGKGATLAISGVSRETQVEADLPLNEFVGYQKQIRGGLYGGTQPRNSIPMLVDLYRKGHLKLDELITNTYALEDINDAWADLDSGLNLRGVILHGDVAQKATAGRSVTGVAS